MKPGYKTTEFWLSLITVASIFGLAFVGKIPAETAVQYATVGGGVYSIGRSIAKK